MSQTLKFSAPFLLLSIVLWTSCSSSEEGTVPSLTADAEDADGEADIDTDTSAADTQASPDSDAAPLSDAAEDAQALDTTDDTTDDATKDIADDTTGSDADDALDGSAGSDGDTEDTLDGSTGSDGDTTTSCLLACGSHGHCELTPEAACVCDSGWTWTGAGVCTDLDECAAETNPCGANATCTNTSGSYTCACATGYVLESDVCVNVDDCTPNPCLNGGSCEDGVNAYTCVCTEGYTGPTCSGVKGACVTDVTICDDKNPCTDDGCDKAAGSCTHTNNTVACDDNNACTVDDACAGGACEGDDRVCDDGEPCTDDGCAPDSGCTTAVASCDDDDACTTDACLDGVGCEHLEVTCADDDACTDDACDSATGCTHAATNCDDGSVCTTDSCDSDAGCVNASIGVCPDSVAFASFADNETAWALVGNAEITGGVLRVTPDGTSKNGGAWYAEKVPVANGFDAAFRFRFLVSTGSGADGLAFVVQSTGTTLSGSEAGAAGGDNRAIGFDSFDNGSNDTAKDIDLLQNQSLVTTTALGGDWSDGLVHEVHVSYRSGLLMVRVDGVPYYVDEAFSFDDVVDEDGKAYVGFTSRTGNSRETHDVLSFAFVPACDGLACADGDACTTHSCDPVLGCQSATVTCADDGDPCTTDSCAPETGCSRFEPDCDDGDPCTTDTCDATDGCKHTALDCDDGDKCTEDRCDSTYGCTYVEVACDDGDLCTHEECNSDTGACDSEGVQVCTWAIPMSNLQDTGQLFKSVGSAAISGNSYWTLVANTASTQGSVWFKTKQHAKWGFSVEYKFSLHPPSGVSGGDGFAFVVQNNASGTSASGDSTGLSSNALSIVADSYADSGQASDKMVVVYLNGSQVGSVSLGGDWSDGATHTMKVVYAPPSLTVTADGTLALTIASLDLDAAGVVDSDGKAYAGFSGSNGTDARRETKRARSMKWVSTCPDFFCDMQDGCFKYACQSDVGCATTYTLCKDSSACTADTCTVTECSLGSCSHDCDFPAVDCDDGDACTTDSCDPDTGCSHVLKSTDTDGDGTCDTNDPCPYDPGNDGDGNGQCDDVDVCDALEGVTLNPGTPQEGRTLTAVVDAPAVAVAAGAVWSTVWTTNDAPSGVDSDTVASLYLSAGDTWKVTVTGGFPWATQCSGSASGTVSSEVSQCDQAVLSPSAPTVKQALYCSCLLTSGLTGALEGFSCRFEDQTGAALAGNGCVLPASETALGMKITCAIAPVDELGPGNTISVSSVVAGNTAPVAPDDVTLTWDTAAQAGDSSAGLACTASTFGSDPDGISVEHLAIWVVGDEWVYGPTAWTLGELEAVLTIQTSGAVSALGSGDTVTCGVAAWDGIELSGVAMSTTTLTLD